MSEGIETMWTSLHSAASEGQVESVCEVLRSGGRPTMTVVAGTYGTPLHQAVIAGHKEIVSVLLEEGCPIDIKNSNGRSVLHWAAGCGQVDLMELFVKGGLDVNVIDNDGRTPLHYAASKRHVECVRVLLSLGGRPSMTVVAGAARTPLHQAVKAGHKEIVSILLEEGCPIDVKDSNGRSVLHWAAEYDQVDLIELFVKGGMDVNVVDNDGRTPLHDAASKGHVEFVRVLLTLGGRPSMTVVAGTYGTPLHQAVLAGHKEIVSVLLEEYCPIDVKDSNGRSVLHWAARHGQVDLMELFVKGALDVNLVDNAVCTPLHDAASKGHVECVLVLLRSGGSPSLTMVAGTDGTPLHEAVKAGHYEIVSVLLEEGCPIDVKDSDGETILHWAAEFGQVDLMELFVKGGLDVNVVDNEGGTPLHYAAIKGHVECVLVLLTLGGRSSMTVVAGTYGTPLHQAVLAGHKEIVSVLLEEGCPIDVKESNGRSVLHWAARHGQVDLIELFVKGGLDVNVVDNDGRIPLHSAAIEGHAECVHVLLTLGGSPSMTVVAGTYGTPLHQAVLAGHKEIVSVLLEEGCPIDVKDSNGRSVLDWAAWCGQVDLIELFVKGGLDVNVVDNDGRTPLHSAAIEGHVECVRALLTLGGRLSVLASTHGSPLPEADAEDRLTHFPSEHKLDGCPTDWTVLQSRNVLDSSVCSDHVQTDNISKESSHVNNGISSNSEFHPLCTTVQEMVNQVEKNGMTPLIMAAAEIELETFKEPRSVGGDIYVSDKFGMRFCDYVLMSQDDPTVLHQFCEACDISCSEDGIIGAISALNSSELLDVNRVLCLAAVEGNANVFDAMVTSQYILDYQRMPKAGLMLSAISDNEQILTDLHISSEPLNPLHIALLSTYMLQGEEEYDPTFIKRLVSHPRTKFTANEVFPNGLSPLDVARQLKLHNIADMIEGAGGGPGLWANLPKEILPVCTGILAHVNQLRDLQLDEVIISRISSYFNHQTCSGEGRQKDEEKNAILEKKPKVSSVVKHVLSNLKCKGKWEMVGNLLEIDEDTLDRLGEESPDSDDAYYSMLKYWLKHGRNVTWKTLLDVVGHFETKKTVDDMTERIVEENTASNVRLTDLA